MTTNEILDYLEPLVLDYRLQFPECSIENGVRFFLPAPSSPAAGTVFAGSLSEWNILLDSQLVYDNCTYLICTEGKHLSYLPAYHKHMNLLILNAPVHTVLQKLNALLTGKPSVAPSVTQLYMDFWNDIMNSVLVTHKQVKARIKSFPYPLHSHVACIVLRPNEAPQDKAQLLEMEQLLQAFFPETNLFFTGSEWIVLYSQKRDTSDKLDISYHELSLFLVRQHMDAGISYVCQLPEVFRTLYLTASASIDLGKHLTIEPYDKRIYTYHQYNPYYVIHLSAKTFIQSHGTDNLIYLAHPDITRIHYYDLEKKGNLIDVLYAYLSCGQNINLAAQRLYMHRNTVLNKLNKIEAIVQHPLNYDTDNFLFLMSCMVLKYQQNYMSRKVEDFFM